MSSGRGSCLMAVPFAPSSVKASICFPTNLPSFEQLNMFRVSIGFKQQILSGRFFSFLQPIKFKLLSTLCWNLEKYGIQVGREVVFPVTDETPKNLPSLGGEHQLFQLLLILSRLRSKTRKN